MQRLRMYFQILVLKDESIAGNGARIFSLDESEDSRHTKSNIEKPLAHLEGFQR